MKAFVMSLLLVVSASAFSAGEHETDAHYDQVMQELCAANQVPVKRSQGTQVFNWTDENGQVHFGDRPPLNAEASLQTLQGRKDYFDVAVSFPAGDIDSNIGDALAVNGRAIAQAMARFIPAERMTKSSIDMKVFSNHTDFIRYKQLIAPSLSNNIGGFYSALDNSVSVWHTGDDDYAQHVALHEATHVFQYKNIGDMPGWLSEGMADYMANMRVQGNVKAVAVNRYRLGHMQQLRRYIPLDRLLTAPYSQFQSQSGGEYYANSWALVYFLMLPENRQLMERYLTDVSQDKCDDMPLTHSLTFFEQQYRGGVAQLQQDWLVWLQGDHQVPNYH